MSNSSFYSHTMYTVTMCILIPFRAVGGTPGSRESPNQSSRLDGAQPLGTVYELQLCLHVCMSVLPVYVYVHTLGCTVTIVFHSQQRSNHS